jgi:hypothetical protein
MNRWDYVAAWVASRRKAIVAAISAVVIARLTRDGLDLSASGAELVTAAITAFSVWLVPNK